MEIPRREVIETTGASAVLVGKDGLGPWQDAEMRGCLSEFVERKLPVIPVLLPGAPEVPRLPFLLKRFTWVDLRDGLTEQGLDRLQWGITGRRPNRSELPSIPTAAPEAAAAAEAQSAQSESAEARPAPPEMEAPMVMAKERINQKARALWSLPAWVALLTILGIAGFLLDQYFSKTGKPRTQRPPAAGVEETGELNRPVQDEATVQPEADNQEMGTPSTDKPTTQNAVPTSVPAATQTKPAVTALETCATGKEHEEAGIVFVRICPGTFTMGSVTHNPEASDDEQPAHQVTLSEFWIGKTEITNEQYRGFRSDHQGEARLPATHVSWTEAKAACEHFGGRLPTEAEWEYAARAGSQTPWSFGDDEKMIGEYAWYLENSGKTLHPVGIKRPNAWGLHDMHGNAYEWVADWYGTYPAAAQADPTGPAAGEYRVLRGGSWMVKATNLRSAARFRLRHVVQVGGIGFRCVCGPNCQL